MKKIFSLCMAFALVLCLVGMAQAKAKDLPAGALVSATALNQDGLTTVTVTGVKVVRMEFYAWDRLQVVQGNSMTVKAGEGRRFNFVFEEGGSEYYALVTPEDAKSSPAWFGANIGAECTSKTGCALLITAR